MMNAASNGCVEFDERFCGHALVNQAVVNVHNQSLSMEISPLRKERLVERLKNFSAIMCVINFWTSHKPIDGPEPLPGSYDCKHGLFPLNIGVGVCCHLIFGQSPHPMMAREKEKPGLIARHQMSPVVFSRRF
jgi:hypothetical protein